MNHLNQIENNHYTFNCPVTNFVFNCVLFCFVFLFIFTWT